MTKSMLLAIAEAAGLDKVSPTAPAPIRSEPTAPLGTMSLGDKISAEWDADANLRSSFANHFGDYKALRIHEEGKAAGLRPEEFKEVTPDVAGYVATLEAKNGYLSASEKTAIEGYAATWRASADIRKEFMGFTTYAAFMRAKASGQARILGQ